MYLAGRTDLDAASAEIDARRLPFAAMRVADSHGQRDPRAGCAPPVRGASRRRDLAGEHLRLEGLRMRCRGSKAIRLAAEPVPPSPRDAPGPGSLRNPSPT